MGRRGMRIGLTGGIASGYIKNTATAFTSGLRVNF